MKEVSDPKLDGFLRVEEVVEHLATGWGFSINHGRDYDGDDIYISKTAGKVRSDTMQRLIDEGWIERYGAGSLRLTDAGHKSYMHSTDEMGDGKLVPPNG